MGKKVVQIRQKGSITLPMDLRRAYGLNEGEVLNIIDLGGGSILLTRRNSQIGRLGDEVSRILSEEEVTLGDLIETLEQERRHYYREQYEQA